MSTQVSYTSSDDFKNEDGKVDWSAYRRAQVSNGEACYRCGKYILFPRGSQEVCSDCQALRSSKDEVTHSTVVRCPKCGESFEPDDEYQLFEEGGHEVACVECEHQFTVETWVEYHFLSPARIEDGGE